MPRLHALLSVALFIFIGWFFASCGKQYNDAEYEDGPAPQDDPAYAAIKPIVDRECVKCHNGKTHPLKFDSAASFKGSKAKTRIGNGSMPPNGQLKDDDKKALLSYLGA